MNIRQYYEQNAAASLHASLVAFIPAIGLLMYIVLMSEKKELILFIIPFLIYSFFCFQKYLLNQMRAKAVRLDSNVENVIGKVILTDTQFLVTFLPAPSLRLLFFHPNGIKVGEIRDVSLPYIKWFIPKFFDRFFVKRYGLYDDKDQPIAYFSVFRKIIDIFRLEEISKKETVLVTRGVRNKNIFSFDDQTYQIENNGLLDFSIILKSTESKVGQIQSGWMPLEWSERFIDANTPILWLHDDQSIEEKLQIFSLLISIYSYSNH